MNLGYAQARTLEAGTAFSIQLRMTKQQPTATFKTVEKLQEVHQTALDWLALAGVAMPNAKPLASDERASINEFFWSHFKRWTWWISLDTPLLFLRSISRL